MKILNASEPSLGSSMTEEETRVFLSNTRLFARLGTIDEKTDPNVHPVWYYFDNERIYFQTGKNSKKLRNIKKKNNIYFCIDQTNLPYKGVRGKGTAIISEDINKNIPIVEKIMLKYTGSLDNNMARFLMDSLKRGESVIIEIIPHFYATWDNSKGQYNKKIFFRKPFTRVEMYNNLHSFYFVTTNLIEYPIQNS